MKILVIDLEGISPELLFADERMTSFRQLMEFGCYGLLEGLPSSPEYPAWLHLAAGQTELESEPFIWQLLDKEGKAVVAIGPAHSDGKDIVVYPPSIRNDTVTSAYALSSVLAGLQQEERFRDEIYDLSLQQFDVARQLMASREWDYFHVLIPGLEMMQEAFWRYLDSSDPLHDPETPYESYIPDYYVFLDGQLAEMFELLDEDTAVMIVSASSMAAEKAGDQMGFFILAAADNPMVGEVQNAHLLDIAPTILEMSGCDIPNSLQGVSLLKRQLQNNLGEGELSAEEEELIRERLSGLGYV